MKTNPALVGSALLVYKSVAPTDAKTIPSIIKKVFQTAETLSPPDFQALLMTLSLEDLAKKMSPDGTRWASEVEEDLKGRGYNSKTYIVDYPRFFKRFLTFAAEAGMLKKNAPELLPAWIDLTAKAAKLIPQNKRELEAYVGAGVRVILDRYTIDVDNVKATNIKLQNVRSAWHQMAKTASAQGLTPQAYAESILVGPRQDEIEAIAGDGIYCSYCRCLWNATVTAYPQLDLPLWPDRRRFIGIPMDGFHAVLRDGLNAAVFPPMKTYAAATVKNYRDTLGAMIGLLHQLGFDTPPLVSDLSPQDAVRLLFQGWPRELMAEFPSENPMLAIYRRLLADTGFKAEVLSKQRAFDGRDGRKLAENPFIAAILAARFAEAKYRSAEKMLDRTYSINNEYLEMPDDGLKWVRVRLDQVNMLIKDNASAYDDKKAVVFKHPRLFETLLARGEHLYRGLDDRFKNRGPHWATFVRDLTYLVLATLYPLRVQNHQLMKLDDNYDTQQYILAFARQEVKNKKPIEFELPAEGNLVWIRDVVDLYLSEARPILLRGAESAYFFVGNHQAPNAKGFLQRQAFNDILIDLTEKCLSDVVPSQLGNLNPHLFRHIAATYQIVIHRDPNMAARLLNDNVQTIYKHYADILGSSKRDCRAFYDNFTSVGEKFQSTGIL